MANRKGSKNAGLRAEIEVALRDQRESLRDFIDTPKAARRGPRQASGATRSVWNLEVDCVAEARRLLLEWDRLVPGTFERDEILAFLRDERKAGRFPYGPADRKAAEDVIAYCRQHIAAYKVPAQVDIIKELPKSPSGKLLKRVLRQQATS